MSLQSLFDPLAGRLQNRMLLDQSLQITRLPIAAFITDFEVGEKVLPQSPQQFDECNVCLDGPELRFDRAPGRFVNPTAFCIFDLHELINQSSGASSRLIGSWPGASKPNNVE